MKVTIKDVAREAEVSVATASMAININGAWNAETKEQGVEDCPKARLCTELFRKRALVTKDSRSIGLLVPEIINPLYADCGHHGKSSRSKKGIRCFLGISNSKSRTERCTLKSFMERRVLGRDSCADAARPSRYRTS